MMKSYKGIPLKTSSDIVAMKNSGKIVSRILDAVGELVIEGNTTMDLENCARALCSELGVEPAFLGYHGFPAVLCISVNEEIVHGIPSPDKILCAGDVVSVDMGVVLDGFYGDSARTFIVGSGNEQDITLVQVTKDALAVAIETMIVGSSLFQLAIAVSSVAEKAGLGVVRQYCGHGIGKALHEDPPVFNYLARGQRDIPFKVGMVLAIEPMFTLGSYETVTRPDGWTVVTRDNSRAAHFEHTVAITENGPEILTISV